MNRLSLLAALVVSAGGMATALPFSREAFFDVFSRYNTAVWPAQIVLGALALAAVAAMAARRARIVFAILAALWLWNAVAYHLAFFAALNSAAPLFAGLFALGAIECLRVGVFGARVRFGAAPRVAAIAGWAFIGYALVAYPLIGIAAGQRYPALPTFGLPCPTTIFTCGVLMLARERPRSMIVAPIAWAAIGSTAAFALGVVEDYGLAVSGLALVADFILRRSATR